ncbi:hypothetical protein D3C71_977590 [compost metagenome]
MFVAFIGQVLQPSDYFVLVGEHIVEHRRAVSGYGSGTGSHGQGDTGFGALHVVGAVEILGHAVHRVGRFMGGGHDPVSEGQILDFIGLQQGIAGHRGALQSGLHQTR